MTLVRSTSPVFLTVMVKLAVPPVTMVWVAGVLAIEIEGLITVTSAEALSVTFGPTGGVPVAVAVLVKPVVTFASVQA